MKLETEHTAKIAKLQAKLESIKMEIEKTSSSMATQYIEQLKLKHSLTDAEILELKSELLRKSIESKQHVLTELEKTGTEPSESDPSK